MIGERGSSSTGRAFENAIVPAPIRLNEDLPENIKNNVLVPGADWCSVREGWGSKGEKQGRKTHHGMYTPADQEFWPETERLSSISKNRARECLIEDTIKLAVCDLPPESTVIDAERYCTEGQRFSISSDVRFDKCLVHN
jgi:hypothetical protein